MFKKNFNHSSLISAIFLMALLPQQTFAKSYYSVFRLGSSESKVPQTLEVVREEKTQNNQTLLKITVEKKEGLVDFHFPNPWEFLRNDQEAQSSTQWPMIGFGNKPWVASEAWSLPILGLPTLPLQLSVTLAADKKYHYQISGDWAVQVIPLSGEEVAVNELLKNSGLKNIKVTGVGEAVLDAQGLLLTQSFELDINGDSQHWHVEWAEGRIE